MNKKTRLFLPPVYPITDRLWSGLPHARQIALLAKAGFSFAQVRENGLPDNRLWLEAKSCVAAARRLGMRLILNNRCDMVLLLEADGVHLGGHDIPARDARKLLGPSAIIGVSTHSVAEALRAARGRAADYVAIGPIYSSRTKISGRRPLGPEAVAAVRRRCVVPLVAIGGITPQNAPAVWEAGADSLAVISAIWKGRVMKNAAQFHDAWRKYQTGKFRG